MHRHPCEEIVVILSGSGKVILEGQPVPFEADCSVVIPASAVHQLVNDGPEPIRIIAPFAPAPVAVLTPDGQPITVPWLTP